MSDPSNTPNIFFIVTDQHLKRTIGAYGGEPAITPCVDSLAREGVLFPNAYTTCPVCSPARASIQTGYYPFRHGMQTNLFMHGAMIHELADSPALLSRRLEQAGYYPALNGKWHLGFGKESFEDPFYRQYGHHFDRNINDIVYPSFYRSGSGMPSAVGYHGDDFPGHGNDGSGYPQFQDYLRSHGLPREIRMAGDNYGEVMSPEESTVDHFLTSRAIELAQEGCRSGSPLFLMLNYWGPHNPMLVPGQFLDPFRNRSFSPWPSFDEDLRSKPRIHQATRLRRPWAYFEDCLRYAMAYSSYIDSQIARFLSHLQSQGLYDESLIIFSADHGDGAGVHGGLVNKAFFMYEEAVTVPLIIKPPASWKSTRGSRDGRLVNLTDLYATILEAAGLPRQTAQERHGRSLVPALTTEGATNWPDTVVTEGSGVDGCLISQRMIRHGSLKYVFNAADTDELYDLEEDPHEMNNRVGDAACREKLGDIRDRLRAWMESRGDALLTYFRRIIENESIN